MQLEFVSNLKQIFVEESGLVVVSALLALDVLVNIMSLLNRGFVSFQTMVTTNLTVLSLAVLSYVIFQLRIRFFSDDGAPDRVEELSANILTHMLSEIQTDETPSDRKIQEILTKQNRILSQNKRQAYDFATNIAKDADDKVMIHSRSHILLLGPRRYGPNATYKHDYERRQWDVLTDLLRRSVNGDLEFYCSYKVADTKREYDGDIHRANAARRLRHLCEYSQQDDSNFTLLASKSTDAPMFSFIAEDERFAIWFRNPGHSDKYICITSTNRAVTDVFKFIFDDEFETVTGYADAAADLELDGVSESEANPGEFDLSVAVEPESE